MAFVEVNSAQDMQECLKMQGKIMKDRFGVFERSIEVSRVGSALARTCIICEFRLKYLPYPVSKDQIR